MLGTTPSTLGTTPSTLGTPSTMGGMMLVMEKVSQLTLQILTHLGMALTTDSVSESTTQILTGSQRPLLGDLQAQRPLLWEGGQGGGVPRAGPTRPDPTHAPQHARCTHAKMRICRERQKCHQTQPMNYAPPYTLEGSNPGADHPGRRPRPVAQRYATRPARQLERGQPRGKAGEVEGPC